MAIETDILILMVTAWSGVIITGLAVWLYLNREILQQPDLNDRLDSLEEGIAQILGALLQKLQHLEELVPSVNLTHNANPLAPLFEAFAKRIVGLNEVQEPNHPRDETGRFNGTPEIQETSTSEI